MDADTEEQLAKQAAAVLTERHKLEAIFRESPAAMALWRGPDQIFELVNPTYQAIFGDRPLIGKTLIEAAPELASQPFPRLIRHVFETGEPYVGHEMLAQIASTPGGPLEDHYYDFTYVRVLDVNGEPYGVYDHAIDVTERVLARRELEAARQRLEATVTLLHEERDLRERFVAALSHDLRTPLHTARLAAELLIFKKCDEAQLRKASKQICDSVERADALIRDLLDASRIRAGEPLLLEIEECDLTATARVALEDLVSMHGERFVLEADGTVRGPWDCRALRRIIENLASNAVKYGSRDMPVTIRIASSHDAATLAVHNHGQPIRAEDLPTLFDLFKRSRNTTGQVGWGIGLSLVQGLVRAHGGTVEVTSTHEAGTTFCVRLPR